MATRNLTMVVNRKHAEDTELGFRIDGDELIIEEHED